jgi:hypothetical protein
MAVRKADMIRAYAIPERFGGAFAISLVEHPGDSPLAGQPRILRLTGGGEATSARCGWETFNADENVEPTMILEVPAVLALAQALAEIQAGTADYRALRRDYDDERKRVDRLLDTITAVAAGGLR